MQFRIPTRPKQAKTILRPSLLILASSEVEVNGRDRLHELPVNRHHIDEEPHSLEYLS